MATRTPVRHTYQVMNPEQYKEVKHYLISEVTEPRILNEMLNVSKDRQFSKAKNVSYWLKGRNTDQKKWSNPITGLKPTGTPFVYFGDIPKKEKGRYIPKDLLIFKFSENGNDLIIDVYSDFYTEDKETLSQLIKRAL